MSNPENRYQTMVRKTLSKVDDKFLVEDSEHLYKYIVLRFLATSPVAVEGVAEEVIEAALMRFLHERFAFILTFMTIINSDPSTVDTEA